MSHILTSQKDFNKIFIVNRSELEGRLEPQYYETSIRSLEKIVLKKSKSRLSDYIVRISSGATPSITEEDRFYSNKENGIPFLRVQNLQTNSELNLIDIKYINQETHETYLKRSQVEAGDLLVKITGVGRMAVASVAPNGFVGNTNQHMVVIKTKSEKISRYLANYLNLNFVERLASKKSTGGTRPALDYVALKSIPIIENIDFEPILKAERQKQQKEAEAKGLLDSIDDYLLDELGISLPKKDNSLKNRIFAIPLSEVTGGRLDFNYNSKLKYLVSPKENYKYLYLKELITKSPQYGANEEALDGSPDSSIRYIRITDIDELGELKKEGWKTAPNTDDCYLLNYNDLLFARSGSVGRCYIHKERNIDAIFAGYLIRFVIDINKVNPDFVFYYCNSSIYKFWVSAIERPTVQSNINAEEFKSLPIPFLSRNKQDEIVRHIGEIRHKAKKLQEEAKEILEKAKREIENIILGE